MLDDGGAGELPKVLEDGGGIKLAGGPDGVGGGLIGGADSAGGVGVETGGCG